MGIGLGSAASCSHSCWIASPFISINYGLGTDKLWVL